MNGAVTLFVKLCRYWNDPRLNQADLPSLDRSAGAGHAPGAAADRDDRGRQPGGRERATGRMAMIANEDRAGGGGRLRPILATIRRHRRWLAATMLIVLAATAVAYTLLPRRFTAHANLWLDHGFDEIAPPSPAIGGALSRNTEIRLLTSTRLAAEVVDTLGLANLRGVGQPKEGARVPPDPARRLAIDAVRTGLRVKATGTSYAVTVGYASADAMLSTGVLNQLVDRYVEDRRSGGERGRERQRLAAQVAAARDDMIRSGAAVTGYRAASDLIGKQEGAGLLGRETAALDAELAVAQADQARAEARAGDLRGGRDGADAGPTSARLRELIARRAQLSSGRAEPGSQGAPNAGPPLATATLTDINREIAAETRRADGLLADARRARERTGLIAAARARAAAERRAGEAASAQLATLNAQAGEAQAGYAALVLRYRRFVAAQRTLRGGAYVISHASVPSTRDFPDPAVFALGGLLAALIAATGVAFVLERFVKGFRTREDLERKLGIRVIGMVPNLAKVRDADFPGDDPMGPPDYLFNHERSAFSAAFRAIHAGLRLGGSARSPRSIAVCSALPEEGKTTVAICLARSAALAGLRVVLVDCDVRRPAASRALTPYVEVGLAEVLAGGVDVRQALMRDTPSGAWFLAHSTNGATANDLINSEAMAVLVARLSREFDLVVLDTAPALALAEARAVAAMADGVLLVARWRTTPVDATRVAHDLLQRAGARVTVAALTLVDP